MLICRGCEMQLQIHLMIAWGDAINIAAQTKSQAKQANMDTLLLFIYIGIISGSCAWIYTSLFKITGFRQGAYWRKAYLEAVMRQDIAWFDAANPSELPSKIAEKTQQVEDGVSAKLGEGAMFFAQFVGGIVVGFIYAWDVALVACVTAPPCAFGLYYLTKVQGEASDMLNKAYSKAGGVASEVNFHFFYCVD